MTKLQKELLFNIESIDLKKPIELYEENYEGLSEDEIERLKKINSSIKIHNKNIE